VSKPESIEQLKLLYEDFFSRYLRDMPDSLPDGSRLNKERVFLSDDFSGPFGRDLEQVRNTYIPVAPMGWIDNIGVYTRVISPKTHLLVRARLLYSDIPGRIHKDRRGRVTNLTYLDSLHVGYLEGRVYSDNPSTVELLTSMQNALMAKDIAGGPALSIKYVNQLGGVRGYLLAYEGQLDRSHPAAQYTRNLPSGEQIVYVSDIASLDPESLSGRKMLLRFLERYKQHYIQTGRPMPPILIEARESTSRRLLHPRHLERFAAILNVDWERRELGVEERGKDRFYTNLLVVRSRRRRSEISG
jgi:hypothetical protein